LFWLGIPGLCLIEVGIVGTLVPDFRGKDFSFSPLSMAVGLSYIAFTMLRYIPSILSFLELLS
jgi:hypothetical protein